MEQNYEQSNSTQTIQPFSAPSGVSTTISITATLLGMISGPAGGTLSIFGTIVNLLWPTSPGNQNVTWNDMMNYTAELVNQKLSEYAVQSAESELNGLKSSIETYRDAVKIFTKNVEVYGYSNPITAQSQVTLISIISGVHQQFVNRITAAFKTNGYKTALLPGYASVATLHLLYLREIVIDHKKLGLDDQDFKYYTNQLYKKVKEYSDYCINTYNDGLNSQKQRGWSYFNKYRREMTLLVLDLIALFSNYDPNNYNPIYDQNKDIETFDVNLYSMETKTELTREIYSDVLNDEYKSIISNDHNTNENRFIRSPHLFDWLEQLKCAKRSLTFQAHPSLTNTFKYDFLSGYQLKYSDCPRNKQNSYWRKSFGDITSGDIVETLINFDGNICTSIETKSANTPGASATEGFHQSILLDKTYITKMTLSVKNKGNLVFDANPRSTSVRTRTYSIENNVLSYIGSYSQNDLTHGYIFGFTHDSVDPQNTIATDKITQIPAVKAYDILTYRKPGEIIKGPGFTGGDLVKLPNDSQLKIRLTPVNRSKSFTIRIHYARKSDGLVEVQKLNNSIAQWGTYSTPATGSNEKFGYIDTLTTSLNQDKVEIVVRNVNSNSDLIVDKVEFIPV